MRLDSVRTDNVNNVDLSIIKNTVIAGKNLQFRFESLNAFNHPLFLPRRTRTRRRWRLVRSAPSAQNNYARRTQIMVKFIF